MAQAFPIICRIESLERLSIYQNPVVALPEEIGRLKRLRVLRAFGCQLRAVPGSILGLTELQELDLRANETERFDVPLERFQHLERLDLSFNRPSSEECDRLRDTAPNHLRIVLDQQKA